MKFDEHLRSELEALEGSAPTDAAPSPPVTREPRWLRTAVFAVPPLLAVAIAIGLVTPGLLPADGPLASPESTADATPAPTRVEAEVRESEFTLTIVSPRSVWRSDEAIDVRASLAYDGPRPQTTIWGGDFTITFDVLELTGNRSMASSRPRIRMCDPVALGRDDPLNRDYFKSVEIAEGDPNAAFYAAFREDPLFHLPPGVWQVSAWASFPTECRGQHLDMRATINLEVTDPEVARNIDCVLTASDCDLALGAASPLLHEHGAAPQNVVVAWGRGLRVWHVELHACWTDGRYILVDVLGPVDAIPPQSSELAVSIREDAWDNPPCD